ncbi:glycosyltransferase family 2 protein [Clostridium grantii]|uniref:Rhamnosyltransferase n=1 Tax=Clostridium grantii DSM 8605 TaxID=1121316 RepID=A0A1M5RLD7_9CLOT|nr:glycosyltransferase [Clostridium grantii]SHH27137.1 rhamnosyltransferase [Clostridium grantii DSM 8605]
MYKISIIMPVYNGEKYLNKLISEIKLQHIDIPIEIIAAVSKSKDNSLNICKELCDIVYEVDNFQHGLTRHEAALKATGNILVFITQDIMPENVNWLNNLVKPLIEENNIIATYSRQIAYPEASETEKLIRNFNYPDYNRIANKDTKGKWGRKTIFYSDSSSATLRKDFLELGGYNFDLGTNEDVIYAINVVDSGKSILYNSQSIIYHSHDFKIKAAFNRYKLIGEFEKKYETKIKAYDSASEGKKLLIYLLRNLLKKFKIIEIVYLGVDLFTRYLGFKVGYLKK